MGCGMPASTFKEPLVLEHARNGWLRVRVFEADMLCAGLATNATAIDTSATAGSTFASAIATHASGRY